LLMDSHEIHCTRFHSLCQWKWYHIRNFSSLWLSSFTATGSRRDGTI
jgi:hypothetical protein